jgi:hypothetical protein
VLNVYVHVMMERCADFGILSLFMLSNSRCVLHQIVKKSESYIADECLLSQIV